MTLSEAVFVRIPSGRNTIFSSLAGKPDFLEQDGEWIKERVHSILVSSRDFLEV